MFNEEHREHQETSYMVLLEANDKHTPLVEVILYGSFTVVYFQPL